MNQLFSIYLRNNNRCKMVRDIETTKKPHKSINFFQESDFLMEIIFQAKMAEYAFTRLKENANHSDQMETWSSIQLILIAAGNVSKILWPGRKANKDRGIQLRRLLKIQDENPIADRKFRDHFEHYDERLEKWTENRNGYYDFAMNPSMYLFGHHNVSRGYNVDSNTLVFQGEVLDLNVIINALKEIKAKCIK